MDMVYKRTFIIQSVSIPNVMDKPDTNFLFQVIICSGKTSAYGVPSLMKIDKTIPKVQVIILANTRELIRQIYGVLETFNSSSGVTHVLGETKDDITKAQILITAPGYLKNKLNNRKLPINLSQLKLIVYDKADELQPERQSRVLRQASRASSEDRQEATALHVLGHFQR